MTRYKHIAAAGFFLISLCAYVQAISASPLRSISVAQPDRFWRTELYFGFNKKDGSEVTEEEWKQFLAEIVTPRFPDGFTVLDSVGQFRSSSGVIVRERSRVLILLYPKRSRSASRAKIDEIRVAYRKLFDQESVLRMDMKQTVEVTF
jgi:hypothetical protein